MTLRCWPQNVGILSLWDRPLEMDRRAQAMDGFWALWEDSEICNCVERRFACIGRQGRSPFPQAFHMEYSEIQTVSTNDITNGQLADNAVALYPDLRTLSATTVDHVRISTGVH